jgi:hypothetical protein
MEAPMQAIEFTSIINNGVIPIPDQYKGKIGNEVKVIAFPEHSTGQSEGSQRKKKEAFHCIGIDMTGFQFDREAANER